MWCQKDTTTEYQHAEPDTRARVQTSDYPRRVKSTEKRTCSPGAIEPSITNGTCVEDAIGQWCDDDSRGEHCAHKERHADSDQRHCRTMSQVFKSLAQFLPVAIDGMRILQVCTERLRFGDHYASLTDE